MNESISEWWRVKPKRGAAIVFNLAEPPERPSPYNVALSALKAGNLAQVSLGPHKPNVLKLRAFGEAHGCTLYFETV